MYKSMNLQAYRVKIKKTCKFLKTTKVAEHGIYNPFCIRLICIKNEAAFTLSSPRLVMS